MSDLALALLVLLAPCFLLSAPEVVAVTRQPLVGRFILGLPAGLALWGLVRLLLALVREVVAVAGGIGRRPWAGEEGWGRHLEAAVFYLLVLGSATLILWFVSAVIDCLMLDPNPR